MDNISLSSCKMKIEWLEDVNQELLETCKALLDEFTSRTALIESCDMTREEDKAAENAIRAIAKAEGRE